MRYRGFLGLIVTALALVASAQEDPFAGKRVVRVLEEPRHRVVYREADLYLLDVQIQAGDTTLPHTHDSAILYTFIDLPDGRGVGATISEVDYAEQPFTHEVANPGPGMIHIIALANYGPGSSSKKGVRSVLGEPQLENPWFRSFRVSLNPGEETDVIVDTDPSVVIQVGEGTVHVTREEGLTEALVRPGSWVWRQASSPFRIRNSGPDVAELVVSAARIQ